MGRRVLDLAALFIILLFTLSLVAVLPVESCPPPKPDFEITADPMELEIVQGGSQVSTITLTSTNGFSAQVVLTNTTSTSGVTLSLNPCTVTPPPLGSATSVLKVEVASNVEPDDYEIIVAGTSGCLEHSIKIMLVVMLPMPPAPDFSVAAAPNVLTIQRGDSNTSVIAITSLLGFSQLIGLEVTSAKITDVNTTLNPTKVVPPSNSFAISVLTVDVATDASLGTHSVTVTGHSDSLMHSVTILLIITAPPTPPTPDFSIHAYLPSLTIEQGDSATSTMIVVSTREFSQSVNLTVTSAPIAGVSIALDPSQLTLPPDGFAMSTLTISAGNTALPNDYTLTVNGTSGILTRTLTISLNVISETTPPVIVSVLRLQETPSYTQSVTVLASVTDGGSGVKQATLNYSSASVWTQVNMTFRDGFYQASIPAFPFDTLVEYQVYASDRNGNVANPSALQSYRVIDLRPPALTISTPTPGSYLSGIVPITVFMKDQNGGGESGFGGAELSINNTIVASWEPPVPSLPATYNWSTPTFGPDGSYSIRLSARDKADNVVEKNLTVTVDNTPPTIGTPSWAPKEPTAYEDIRIDVRVTESAYGSGVQSVALWFRNKTMEDWQFLSMRLKTGNWTAVLSKQSDTNVRFYIEVFDRAGNNAISERKQFIVSAPSGIPLATILAIITLMAAVIGGSVYYLRRVRKEPSNVSATPFTAAFRTYYPPQFPPPTPMRKVGGVRT